jgi:large subunit ribosomal protein L32
MRSTRSHTGNRRSHHALKARGLSVCANCGAAKEKHSICMSCGQYKGRKVVDMEATLKKQTKKAQEKAAAKK